MSNEYASKNVTAECHHDLNNNNACNENMA